MLVQHRQLGLPQRREMHRRQEPPQPLLLQRGQLQQLGPPQQQEKHRQQGPPQQQEKHQQLGLPQLGQILRLVPLQLLPPQQRELPQLGHLRQQVYHQQFHQGAAQLLKQLRPHHRRGWIAQA